jgi:hypothetical protein
MKDVPGPQEKHVEDADDQQHRQAAPVETLEIGAARLEALHLQEEPEPEEEGEKRVGLVHDQPAQHVEQGEVPGCGRERQQLLLGGHDGRAGEGREIHEEHAEQGHAAQNVHDLDAIGSCDRRQRGGQKVTNSDSSPRPCS